MSTVHLAGHEDTVAAHRHSRTRDRFLGRPVALVGFMGVGKTAVGCELATLLDRPFIDTDLLVQETSGRSIPELFAEGEPVFRRLEREALIDALDQPPCVLALGGGAFGQPGAAELLLPKALVVHLHTPWSVLLGVLDELAGDRPLVRDRQPWQVQDLFLSRAPSYRRAHLRVSLTRSDPAEAARSIAEVLRRPGATESRSPEAGVAEVPLRPEV